jgi:hypothetical protein
MRFLLLAALTAWAFYFLLDAGPARRPTAAPIDQSQPLPAGKPNVHFRDARLKDAFKDWLTMRGVPHRVHFVGGREYVEWDGPESLSYDFMTGGKEAWK